MSTVVEPLAFLFCNKCDTHVVDNFYLGDHKVEIDQKAMTDEDRKKRVAPVVHVKAKPKCSKCDSYLVQKYVVVKGTLA